MNLVQHFICKTFELTISKYIQFITVNYQNYLIVARFSRYFIVLIGLMEGSIRCHLTSLNFHYVANATLLMNNNVFIINCQNLHHLHLSKFCGYLLYPCIVLLYLFFKNNTSNIITNNSAKFELRGWDDCMDIKSYKIQMD